MLSALRSGAGKAGSRSLIARLSRFTPIAPKVNRVSGLRNVQARHITTVQAIPPKRRRWPLLILGLGLAGAYGYWKWLTYHKFPPSVAELLREGLWATINGAGYRNPDYRKALGKYIEALQEADRLGMVPWSDEYTGIQIIIADLYERLHLLSEAASMYAEVADTYLLALSRGKIPPEDVDRIITRDLRVVLLAGLLMSTDANSFRAAIELMGPHMVMATREAAKKSEELQFLLHEYPVFNVGYLKDIQEKRLPSDLFESCWGSYKNELFAMREMMTGIAAASGEYMQALMIKLKTTQMMLTSGFPAGECLLSAANIASLMYLQAVSVKFTKPGMMMGQRPPATGAELSQRLMDARNSDSDFFINDDKQQSIENKANDDKTAIEGAAKAGDKDKANKDNLATKPEPTIIRKQPDAQSFLNLANTVYGEIIDTVNRMDQRRTDFIPESYVMALYGQGVIASSQGDYQLAADRLGEARLRSRGSQIETLLETAEEEIAKVEKLTNMTEEEIKNLHPSELPAVDVMFWKLTPDVGEIDRPDLPDTRL